MFHSAGDPVTVAPTMRIAGGFAAIALAACASSSGGDDEGPVTAIHVSLAGSDLNPGTADAPLRHVALAIARAADCAPDPCAVRISAGDFDEPLVLASGVSLLGGHSPDFTSRDPSLHPTVLTAASPRAVVANGLTAPTALDGLTIRGFDNPDVGGPSGALWIRDSGDALTLRTVRIEAGDGAPGAEGDDGALVAC